MRADLFSPEIEPSISIVGMLLNLIHQVSENVVAKKKEEEKKNIFSPDNWTMNILDVELFFKNWFFFSIENVPCQI